MNTVHELAIKPFRKVALLFVTLLGLVAIIGSGGGGGGAGLDVNNVPVANAGHNMNALQGSIVVLDGSKSSDADLDELTYTWSIVSKPLGSAAVLFNETSSSPSFIADEYGGYGISLTVNDGVDDSEPVQVYISAYLSSSNVRDTGLTNCYNNSTEIDCSEVSYPYTGQDAIYSTNPLLFENGVDVVTDSITGLIWQKEDDGVAYNWYQAMGVFDAAYNPGPIDVCGSLDLGGYSDWRLPSRRELVSLVNYSNETATPVAENSYFQSSGTDYWTSTTTQVSTDVAWVISGGSVTYGLGDKGSSAFLVRCVRGAIWNQNLMWDDGNGVIRDNLTDLAWQMNDDGIARNWEQALAYCENFDLGGSSEWRLPDIKELESLVAIILPDETYYLPAIDATLFPTTQNDDYWSSTTSEHGTAGYAWTVDFALGSVERTDKAGFKFVRCVE